mgnify:CR=1 FL=1
MATMRECTLLNIWDSTRASERLSPLRSRSLQPRICSCILELPTSSATISRLVKVSMPLLKVMASPVAIGFRSGNIDTVMQRIADAYEKETDERMQSIIAVLEPTLVIILSIIVGLILLSVILPLMGIMSSIG